MKKIDVVIPSRTTSQFLRKITELCIQSLRSCESETVKFFIIVCEQIPTEEYPCADVTLHYDFDFNYNKVLNYGAEHSDSEYILFSNNDMVYIKGFAEELLTAMSIFDSVSPNDLTKKWYVNDERRAIEGTKVSEILHGWSFMVKRVVWEQIGKLDTDVWYWHSDYLYADQLNYFGFSHALCTKAYAIHMHNTTSDTMSKAVLKKMSDDNMSQYKEAKKKYRK